MKIKISINKMPLIGYTNIDPFPIIPDQYKDQMAVKGGDIKNLEVSQSSCTEIICEDIMDFIPYNEFYKTIEHYVSKLRHNGRIVISGTDMEVVSKMYLNGELNTLEFNRVVHGEQNNAWSFKLGQITIEETSEILIELGLKIQSKSINGMCFQIVGVRL